MFFYTLGKGLYRWRWIVLGVWAVALAASAPFVPQIEQPLKTGGFANDQVESSKASTLLKQKLNYSDSTLVILFSATRELPKGGSATLPGTFGGSVGGVVGGQNPYANLPAYNLTFVNEMQRILSAVKKYPNVGSVVDHLSNPRQVSKDGKTTYEVIILKVDPEAATKDYQNFRNFLYNLRPNEDRLTGIDRNTGLQMVVSGGPAFFDDVEAVSQDDLKRAEVVALPFAIIALLFVFGSAVAASVPVIVGGAGVAVILALIFALGHATDLSIFVVNLATLLGLGLGLDYSLFVTSRFREELARARHRLGLVAGQKLDAGEIQNAVAATVATAGRAVLFSGLTVLIGLASLITFDFMFLRSVGIAGVVVVFVSLIAALSLLPALLAVLGERVNALTLPFLHGVTSESAESVDSAEIYDTRTGVKRHGFWARLAYFVMRYPVRVIAPVLVLLLAFGIPFLNIRFNSPDASILPKSTESRRAFDLLNADFNQSETGPITIAVQKKGSSVFAPDNVSVLYDYVQNIAKDPAVVRVDSIVSADPRIGKTLYQTLYSDPANISDPYFAPFSKAYANGDTALISVVSKYPPFSAESQQLVRKIRNSTLGYGFTVLVGGGSAAIMDTVNKMYGDFPKAIIIIVITTYIILLLLFRSVVLPVKALVMNTFSILASYGALVFVFQDGFLHQVLNFTPLGFLEPSLPIIMFCTLFGLSMDYEVFLLSRIKEAYDKTGDNTAAVASGMQRSGKIITSAALIIILVAISFVTADVVLVKALGLGMVVAVFLDATIVRALLVPATMRLLGHWNWYAPAWVLRILPKAGLDESESFAPPSPLTPPAAAPIVTSAADSAVETDQR